MLIWLTKTIRKTNRPANFQRTRNASVHESVERKPRTAGANSTFLIYSKT